MPRAKKTAEAQSNEEGLPKWAEDEIKSAQFGKPEVVTRTGYILEIYEKDYRLDIQVYEPMPDGRVIIEGISLPKEVKINDLMKGFVYEFKINVYTAPLSDKVTELLKTKFNLDMKAIFNFEMKELALMDVESDMPAPSSSSAGEDGEGDED
ncbi:hypothetical protein NTE_02216 [Candidatus Nitrososphaera evergladensis SR1]|jgi:hypothetical protein|uniref:Uncharacterized protein n=1 Tax=Candidatus Nitrososphaera evergladensis SR1 TaxID=1459636 RepID=A0A075MSX1_9ARCH|nr:hypothetical protein [Candidatus Nitrososphaera evergladensis]AIF84270.1 hypothetical protein NTE_02216 [Candidatus Nitrososphaera evergladensis SR1]